MSNEETTPSEVSTLWASLTQIPRPWKVVDFPRLDPITKKHHGKVAIWVLSQQEQHAATAEAERVVSTLLKDQSRKKTDENTGYDIMFNNEATVQVLARACRDPENIKRPAFPSAKLMSKEFSTQEIGALMSAYIQVQAELGPIVANMSPEEMTAWLDRIAESAGATVPLYFLSPEMKNELLIFSASRLKSYRTVTSSAGSPPAATVDDSSTESDDVEHDKPVASAPTE